jgi:hypothetical protein
MEYFELVDKYIDTSQCDKETVGKIHSLFKNLCCYSPSELIEKCCKNQRLQELVQKKIPEHYPWKEIPNLDQLIIKDVSGFNMTFDILDNNHCPNCDTKGYKTDRLFETEKGCYSFIDCPFCFHFMCRRCAMPYDKIFPHSLRKRHENDCNTLCTKCYTILGKIANYKAIDQKRFHREGNIDIKHVLKLLTQQDHKCFLCHVDLLVMFYKPHCSYQFSIDRIDNSKPHDKDNVRITCYDCNCNFHSEYQYCPQKCHPPRSLENKIRAVKFSHISSLESIQYDPTSPIGKQYRSKIMFLCGVPLMMDWFGDEKDDNQFATWLMAEPKHGFAPYQFQRKAGTVVIFRQDGKDLSINDAQCVYDFLSDLMNYMANNKEYESWYEMVFTDRLNFKEAWNKKQIEFVSV